MVLQPQTMSSLQIWFSNGACESSIPCALLLISLFIGILVYFIHSLLPPDLCCLFHWRMLDTIWQDMLNNLSVVAMAKSPFQRFLPCPSNAYPLPCCWVEGSFDLHHHWLSLSVLRLPMNGIHQYSFAVSLDPLVQSIFHDIYRCLSQSSSFLLIYSVSFIKIPQFIYLLSCQWTLGLFLVWGYYLKTKNTC